MEMVAIGFAPNLEISKCYILKVDILRKILMYHTCCFMEKFIKNFRFINDNNNIYIIWSICLSYMVTIATNVFEIDNSCAGFKVESIYNILGVMTCTCLSFHILQRQF